MIGMRRIGVRKEEQRQISRREDDAVVRWDSAE